MNRTGIITQDLNTATENKKTLNKLLAQIKKSTDADTIYRLAKKGMSLALSIDDYDNFLSFYQISITKLSKLQQYNKVIVIIEDVLPEAKKRKDRDKIVKAYHNLGIYYGKVGQFNKAINILKKAIKINKKYKYLHLLSANYQSIGNLYKDNVDYALALDAYLKAAILFEKTEDTYGITAIKSSLGGFYLDRQDYKNSLSFYKESLGLAKENSFSGFIPDILYGIAAAYFGLKKYDDTLNYAKESILYAKKYNDWKTLAFAYNCIGVVYIRLGEFQKAYEYFKKTLDIRKKSDKKILISDTLINLAIAKNFMGNYKEALSLLKEAEKIASKYENWKHKIQLLKAYSDVYENMQDFENSKKYLKLAYDLKSAKLKTELDVSEYLMNKKEGLEVLKVSVGSKGETIERSNQVLNIIIDNKIVCLYVENILWVKAEDHFINIQTKKENLIVKYTFSDFCNIVSDTNIVRVHKSWAVNLNHITNKTYNKVFIPFQNETKIIPVGRKYKF